MKINIFSLLGLGRRKEKREEQLAPPAEPVVAAAEHIDLLSKFRNVKNIFVGSQKGGVGKSFISSTLAVVAAAYSPQKVYAVDTDFDNATLSMVLPPPGALEKLRRIGKRFFTAADVLIRNDIPSNVVIPKFTYTGVSCNDQKVEFSVRAVFAYDPLRLKEQQIALRNIDLMLLQMSVKTLANFFASKEGVVIFDGKQKSNLGINYEPLYKYLISYSDVFILVTEPPYLNFSAVTMPYRDYLDKTFIVVNKVERIHKNQVLLFVRDAVEHSVPVMVFPLMEEDRRIFVNEKVVPAARSLRYRSALYGAALAKMLGIASDGRISALGCGTEVNKIIDLHAKLLR